MDKLTYFLVVLVVATLGLSSFKRGQPVAAIYGGDQARDRAERFQETRGRFPVAEFDEPDVPDPEKNRANKEKQKRYNNFKLVSIKPQPWKVETLVTSDSLFAFPALPVAQSDMILTGVVGSAKAHLSENKKNVFSEFTVAVESVHKATDQRGLQNSVITVDRVGGFVKYPNGQQVLYRFAGANMPKVGTRYLFFLKSKNAQDHTILTAYELTGGNVSPLDTPSQFATLEGLSEEEILQKLREILLKSGN